MFYMISSTEIAFIRDMFEQLADLSWEELSDFSKQEVLQALSLLNKLSPVETDLAMKYFDNQVKVQHKEVAVNEN